MTLFHFGNCLVLSYAPYLITYKYSGLSDSSALWRCSKAGGIYFLTQLCKIFIIALIFPIVEDGTDEETLSDLFMHKTVDLVDYIGIYLAVTKVVGKGEMRIMVTALGWGTAQIIGTKLLPLWMGARGTEFDWKYIQSAFTSNIDLVNLITAVGLLWLWSRNDSKKSQLITGIVILGILCYKAFVFQVLGIYFGLNSWLLVAGNALLSLFVGAQTLKILMTIPVPVAKTEAKTSKTVPSRSKRKPQSLSPAMISDLSSEEEPTEEERLAAARVQRRRRCNKEQQLYSMKYKLLKQAARSMIYENIALARKVDLIHKSIEKEAEERNSLLLKLLDYQSRGVKPKVKSAKEDKKVKKATKERPAKRPSLKPSRGVRKSLSPSLPMLHSPSMSLGSDNQEMWSPRASGGRSEGGLKGKKGPVRRIQAIPMEKDGTPVFPIVIGTLKVLDLGKIVHDRPAFHSDRYLLPAGYTSVRIYPSIKTPSQKCEYTCRIIDAGETPLFEMVAEDDLDNPVRASSSSQCHAQVLKAINKARGKIATNTGSGPDFFGYGNPTIMNLIQKLPGSEKCTKYKRVAFEASNRMAKGSSAKGSKGNKSTTKALKMTPEPHNVSMEDDSSLLGTPTLGLSPFENSHLLFPTPSTHLMDFSLSSSPSFMDSDASSESEQLGDTKQTKVSSSFM